MLLFFGWVLWVLKQRLAQNFKKNYNISMLLTRAAIKPAGQRHWTCSTTYFTEPCRVRVVEQVYLKTSPGTSAAQAD
jgi:hypothetical protein